MKFIVNGGKKLEGAVNVFGSKNAATPIIAATLLTSKTCVISNVPRIGDVMTLLSILESIGSNVSWLDDTTLRITNSDIDPSRIDNRLVRRIRSSVLIVGPILARFGKIKLSTPGGCHIGIRPLDAHLEAFKELGVSVRYDAAKEIYELKAPKSGRWGNSAVLREFSVTATENLLMLGAVLPSLNIDMAAAEPHVQDLGNFINTLGANITGLGTHTISMKGKKNLGQDDQEIKYTIISDPIEAGTFMVLGTLTGGRIYIKNAPIRYLTAPIQKLKEFGADFKIIDDKKMLVSGSKNLHGVKLQTLPYPGFPTDLQAPFGVLATQSRGETLIFDTLYEGRLRYIKELIKMGAKAKILDPHRALIYGKTPLHGATIKSLDLRAGATLVIAALIAKGKSTLHDAEQIDRGYERIEERLKILGADIERIK